jgi:segregation and condensation protein B
VERDEQKRIVEALILAAREPLAPARIASAVPRLSAARARELALELKGEYDRDGRGFELVEAAGGFQLRTRAELRAALESLAVVAYRQPVTRAEIEQVRGVDCGPVLRSLLERHLLRIAGHRDVPGRPMLYATTRRFLEVFGLASLEDLPTLRDLDELVRAAGEAGAAELESGSRAAGEAHAAGGDEDEEAPEDDDEGASPELH